MLGALAFKNDVVLLTVVDIGGDPTRTQHGLQGAPDIADIDAHVGGAVVVDGDFQLGLGFLEVGIDVDQARVTLLDLLQQRVTPLRQLLVIAGTSDDQLERLRLSAGKPLTHHRKCPDTGEVGQILLHIRHDLPPAAAFGPVFEHHNDDAGVEGGDGPEGTRSAHQQASHLAIVDVLHHPRLDLIHVIGHVLVCRALRPVDDDEEGAAILPRRVFRRQLGKQPASKTEQRSQPQQGHPAPAQDDPQHLRIVPATDSQGLVYPAAEPVVLAVGLENLGSQHRRKRQGNEAGEGHGCGHGQGKFGKETAHIALQESDGHKNGDQYQRGRDHREGDLPRAAVGRDQGRLTLLVDTPAHVLEHDDGVVHNQTDGQYQGKQSQQVDGKIEEQQGDKGGGHRHWHRHGRNQNGPWTAKEQEDREHHQHQGNRQGGIDLFHGAFDEYRTVEAGQNLHAFGQRPVQLCHQRRGDPRHLQGVGRGLALQADAYHGNRVATEQVAVLFGAALDTGHITQANQIVVRSTGYHQTGEILGCLERTGDPGGELSTARFDRAGRQLDVFGTQCGLDVGGGEIACGQRLAVQPDAHGITLGATYAYPGDAFKGGKAVHQKALGIIGQLRQG